MLNKLGNPSLLPRFYKKPVGLMTEIIEAIANKVPALLMALKSTKNQTSLSNQHMMNFGLLI